MVAPTSRVDHCARRLAAMEESFGIHPAVRLAHAQLLTEVMREAFVSGYRLAGGHEIEALSHFENVLTAKQLERSEATR